MALPNGPKQVGNPAAISANSALGFSATGYRPSEIDFENCEATQGALALLGGGAPRNHKASEPRAPARRAEVEHIPCCTAGVGVAIPATHPWVKYCALKTQGVERRRRFSS